MRLAAYKKAIDEAEALPSTIPELLSYFKTRYSPYLAAIHYILKMARKDKLLFDSEFCELYEWHLTSKSSRPDKPETDLKGPCYVCGHAHEGEKCTIFGG